MQLRGDTRGVERMNRKQIHQTPQFLFFWCLVGVPALVGPKAKLTPGQLGVREKKPFLWEKALCRGAVISALLNALARGCRAQRKAHTALDFVTFLLQGWDKALENSVVHKLQTWNTAGELQPGNTNQPSLGEFSLIFNATCKKNPQNIQKTKTTLQPNAWRDEGGSTRVIPNLSYGGRWVPRLNIIK